MPLPPTPPGTTALGPPPPKPLYPPPHPHRVSFKKKTFFFFLCGVETSKIRRKLRNLLRPWGPCPYHLPPRHRSPWTPPEPPPSLELPSSPYACNQGPWFTALSTRPAPVGNPPHPTGHPSKTSFSFLYALETSKFDASCEICPWGPCPYHLPPRNHSPWTPPSRALVRTPTPQGIFLYVLETSKLCRKLRNLLCPWGLCPYHLPPRHRSPWTPPPEPLYPPTPQGILQKKSFVFFFCTHEKRQNYDASCEICSVPGARAPTTYPPGTTPLDPPPSPSLGPRGGPTGLSIGFGPNPFFATAIQPLRPPQPSPATKALGLPPCPPHRASFKKHHFTQVAKFAGARAPTTYPPGTTAPGPPLPSPCTHPHPTGYPSKKIIFLLFVRGQAQHFRASRLVSAGRAALSSLAARFCWQGQHFRLWTVPERVSGPPPSMLPGAALSSFAARFCWQGQHFRLWTVPERVSGPPPSPPLRPPPTLSCNQGPWFTALSTRPAPVGTPPPHRASFKKKTFFFFLYALETSKIRRKLRNLLRPWGPCPYHLPPRNQSPWTPAPEPLYPPHPTGYPFSPATKALGLPPCPPGQLRWVTPPPHRASFKNIIFIFFCTR